MASRQDQILRNNNRRLSNGTASIFSHLEELEAYWFQYIDSIWDELPGFRSSALDVTLQERALGSENILNRKYERMITDTQFSYSAGRREAAWSTDEILSYQTRTYQVTGGQFNDAWNGKHNPLANEKEIARRVGRQNRALMASIDDSIKKEVSAKQAKSAIAEILGTQTHEGKHAAAHRAALRKGAMVNTNGIFWDDYRVLRTEQGRLNSAALIDNIGAAQAKGANERLLKGNPLDDRTRQQSYDMATELNELGGRGQISDSLGRFVYPDGNRYRMGDQPAQWAINDRGPGYTHPIVLDVSPDLQDDIEEYQESGQPTKWQTYREWAEFNGVEMREYIPPYEWP